MIMSCVAPVYRNTLADTKRTLDGLVIALIRPTLYNGHKMASATITKRFGLLVREVYATGVSAKQR